MGLGFFIRREAQAHIERGDIEDPSILEIILASKGSLDGNLFDEVRLYLECGKEIKHNQTGEVILQ